MDSAIRQPDPILHATLAGDAQGMNGDTCYLLANKVKGPACSVVKLVERGNGLDAVRMLHKEYRAG